MKSNKLILFLVMFTIVSTIFIENVEAIQKNNYIDNDNSYVTKLTDDDPDDQDSKDCQYIFGDPNNESSVAYMMQKVFNYLKIIGPLLVIILSGFDFAKNTLMSDQDSMKKATKKLSIRLLCAVALYFVPLITSFILNLINNTTGDQACGIK